MRIKNDKDIRVDNLNSAILFALIVADQIWKDQGVKDGVTVTSGNEGYPGDEIHHEESLHYAENTKDGTGRAVDLRVWDVDKDVVAELLRSYLPYFFDVVLETHHIHIELDD